MTLSSYFTFSVLRAIGITNPNIIEKINDVFQSIIAPIFPINTFQSNVTIIVTIKVRANTRIPFKNNSFVVIFSDLIGL